jgi:hypothetical protein
MAAVLSGGVVLLAVVLHSLAALAVAHVEVATHLVLQGVVAAVRMVVTAGGVHPDPLRGRRARPIATLRDEVVQRPLGELGSEVPRGHVEDADGNGTVTVTPGLLVPHGRLPDAMWVEVAGVRIAQ